MPVPAVGAAELGSAWRSLFPTEDHGVLMNSNKTDSQRELPQRKARHGHESTVTISAASALPEGATAAPRLSRARRRYPAERIHQGLTP